MNTWPDKAGCLCARMSRGFNGQDAEGLLVVTTLPDRQSANSYKGGVASTLMERQYKSGDDLIVEDVAMQNSSGNGISGTLDSHYYKGAGEREGSEREFVAIKKDTSPRRKYIVRRLTPTECARLQGFPDWWTDGAEGSDSAQYKLWGNGIALPCAVDVLGRIAREIRRWEP